MKIHLISTRAYPHDESSGCEIGINGTSLQISFVSTKIGKLIVLSLPLPVKALGRWRNHKKYPVLIWSNEHN